MGLVDRVNSALAETRAIGSVPWQPWLDPYQRWDTGGPAHPSRSGAGGVDGALALQPVYSCVRFIAEGVGKTPVLQYRDTGKRKVKMPPGPFITSPSSYLRPFDWKVVGMTSVLLHGMGVALVTSRDGYGYPLSAEWLPKDQVTITDSQPFNPLKAKYYYAGRPVAREDLFIIRGLSVPGRTEAISPIRAFQSYIESGHNALDYGAGWYRSGGFPPGVFKNSQYEVTDEQSAEIKGRLVRAIRRHEPLVHGSDWEFSPITVPPNEAQFIECAVGSAMFSLPSGARRRADQLAAGDEVLSWDGARLVPAAVSAVSARPPGPVIRVRTQCGRQLETSPQHPYWASRRPRTAGKRYKGSLDDNARWLQAAELQPEDYVRVALDWDGGGDLDSKTAWALGALVGDGSLTGAHAGFTSTEPAIVARLDAWLAERGASLVVPDPARPSCYRINTGGRSGVLSGSRRELREFGMLGLGAEHKHVPDAVMTGGRKAQAAFLGGYLDTDGCVVSETRPQPIVFWSSVSRRLLDECQHMLAMLGVQSAIRLQDLARTRVVMGRECSAKAQWTLTVCGRSNVALLASLLAPAHPRKAARLAAWRGSESRGNGVRSDIRWTRVAAVDDAGEQVTYAVTVTGAHTHVTEGLITHNSMQLNATQIASIYGVQPRRAGGVHGDSMTYSNVEFDAISEITDTLDPWLVRFEEAYFECLPRPQLAEFDRDARIRHDIRTRYDVYRVARDIGVMNVNEVRELEDREPLPVPRTDDDYDGKDFTPLQIQVAAARGMATELGSGPANAPNPQSVKTGGIPEPGAPAQPGAQAPKVPGPVKQVPPPVPAANGKGRPAR